MGIYSLVKVICVICFIQKTDSAPYILEYNFKFDDGWDFKKQLENAPILTSQIQHAPQPLYTYSEDLKVEGLSNEFLSSTFSSRNPKGVKDGFRSILSCGICQLGVGLLHKEVVDKTPFEEIKGKFVSLCVAFRVESLEVCTGIFDIYGPEILPALQVATIDASEICDLLFGDSCADDSDSEIAAHKWNVELPNVPKPALKRTTDTPKLGLPFFKVLHISDTHYDPDYVEGSISNCDQPLCCRSYSTPSEESAIPAGKWGSYQKCDAPRALIENILRHIADEHPDIDYIIWTGDLPPHDIWNQTKNDNLEVIKDTVNMVLEAFPDKPIFPAIGNHESSPSGNFAPPWMKDESHSTDWLYEEIARHWKNWLPESTEDTVRRGAFYSVLLRPGFRLVSLNTNYCHTLNWWLVVNSTDPASELKWLVHQLQEAEVKNEKVHIIGHIAPGSFDCMKVWSSNFYRIVERYENTIVGQFYGHSHADEFEIFYDTSDYRRPTNVAYLGPSVTTYQNYNPAYRIYYVDGDHANTTREVLDHETWTADLDAANKNGELKWYKLYSALQAYRMKSLQPEEWDKLLQSMTHDDEVFYKFYKYYYRDSSMRPFCDRKCKKQILCELKSAKSNSKKQLCPELQEDIPTT